jgi:hypothetical protein
MTDVYLVDGSSIFIAQVMWSGYTRGGIAMVIDHV